MTRSDLKRGMNYIVAACHQASAAAGWWSDPHTGLDLDPASQVPLKLLLVHAEISEAVEGFRKDLPDDKLPHRPMIEVELADAVIRIADLAGALGLDIGGALVEKLDYNAKRVDHTLAHRAGPNGKRF